MSCCESGASDGSLCQVTELRVALPYIKANGGYLPSKMVCNFLLQNAGLMKGNTGSHSIGMGHEAINILSHVVADIRIGDVAGIAHHPTNIVTTNEFIVASCGGAIGSNGKTGRNAEQIGAFQNGDAARNRADKSLVKTAEFSYRKVGSTFVVAKMNVHFLSAKLQAGQIRLIKGMLLCIKVHKILTNKNKGSASPVAGVGT